MAEKQNHSEIAKDLFMQGYNCCQAVVASYADEFNIDKKSLLMLASSFGAGMGRLREVCGAVSGMFMVEGLRNGFSNPDEIDASKKKAEHYQRIQNLAKKFADENGSIICRDLLGLEPKKATLNPDSPIPENRTPDYYKKRPCAELVAMVAGFLEEEDKIKE